MAFHLWHHEPEGFPNYCRTLNCRRICFSSHRQGAGNPPGPLHETRASTETGSSRSGERVDERWRNNKVVVADYHRIIQEQIFPAVMAIPKHARAPARRSGSPSDSGRNLLQLAAVFARSTRFIINTKLRQSRGARCRRWFYDPVAIRVFEEQRTSIHNFAF